MKFRLSSYSLEKIDKVKLTELAVLLNHAIFKKSDVRYSEEEKNVVIPLRRLVLERRKFLWFTTLVGDTTKTTPCVLIVREVQSHEISDEHPEVLETSIGVGVIKDHEVSIVASCEQGNGYRLSIKVARLDLTLEDA